MRLHVEAELVEQAVFLFARGAERVERELHASMDPLYALPPGAARNVQFEQVYRDFFRRLGLDVFPRELLAEQPLIAQNVGRCLIRRPQRGERLTVELFSPRRPAVQPADRTLVMEIPPVVLIAPERMALPLRRELLHVTDMLDDAFRYRPADFESPTGLKKLVRDRYRILWDVYVEGRLLRSGRSCTSLLRPLQERFVALFSCLHGRLAQHAFLGVLDSPALTHPDLWAWAQAPIMLLEAVSAAANGVSHGGGRAGLAARGGVARVAHADA